MKNMFVVTVRIKTVHPRDSKSNICFKIQKSWKLVKLVNLLAFLSPYISILVFIFFFL